MKTDKSNIQRIDRVVDYLNEQVESTPTLQDLAGIAGISPYHFHRVYRAITGETPSGTVRRLRLARAAVMLKDSQKPVTEIAFDVGYESSQAFSKALRAMTGCSASELRQAPGKLATVIRDLSGPPGLATAAPLEVKVLAIAPFKVIAARHVGPNEGQFETFGSLFRWAEQHGRANELNGIYGIPIDDIRGVPEAECRFDCCFDLGPDVAAGNGYREAQLGGGRYAVARHVVPYEGLEGKYDLLFGSWLTSSGYALREAPFYNCYLADPDTLPPEQWETDLYLPIV